MNSIGHNSVSAQDVFVHIVELNDAIESVWCVIYIENLNWVEQVKESRLTEIDLRAAVRQDSGPRRLIELTRQDVLDGALGKIERELGENQLLGVTSRAQLSNKQLMHIPMMDFRCRITNNNLRSLAQLMPEIGQNRGFILESGRSYHFYGTELLSNTAWAAFLGKCLLMRKFSDERYIGHQLVDGHCVLRLSTTGLKPVRPTVVLTL